MVHNIESFVETLRADGVEAGRVAAEKIRSEAQQQAEKRIQEAEVRARDIVKEAERQREVFLKRTETDLKLAARDTIAQLRNALNQSINGLLSRAASATLDDDEFLKTLIRDVVTVYAQADATGEQIIEFKLPEEKRRQLANWIIGSFHQSHDYQKLSVEVHGMLATAGFEYKLNEGTVEITRQSVAQVLSQFVELELEELIVKSEEAENA